MAATPGGAGCCVLGAAHAPWGAGTLGTRAHPRGHTPWRAQLLSCWSGACNGAPSALAHLTRGEEEGLTYTLKCISALVPKSLD